MGAKGFRSLFVFVFFLTLTQSVQAHEAVFGYSYTTDTLPQGRWELEQTYWGKFGKAQGDYANSLFRTELEYGVTDNFQTAFYVNTRHVYASQNNQDGTTGGEDVPDDADPNSSFNDFKFDSVSLEAFYRVLSPYKDPVGLAVYIEPAVGPDKFELESKLILQKNFLDDRLVFAINTTWALEWEQEEEEADWEREMEWENTFGASYRFMNNWWGGVEFRNHQEFEAFRITEMEHSAYFLGPTIHYGGKNFWTTTTLLFQLPVARGLKEDQRAEIVDGKIFGKEHENVELRIKVGFPF